MFPAVALLSFCFLAVVHAQQIGTLIPEVHPTLTWQTCTAGGACTTNAGSITLDANWRWLHSTSGDTNCYTGNAWNEVLCPDPFTCATNCALDGADYSDTFGITTTGNELRLQYINTGTTAPIGSRVYLMANNTEYELFKVLNQEFSFDVDVSNLPCAYNGAVYFTEMAADGGLSKYPNNKAGAQYGTGYCDSQCPHDLQFINGAANEEDWTSTSARSGTGLYGSCCDEMDIWEANGISAAYVAHPCSVIGQTECSGTSCEVCDMDGCDFNSYRNGDDTFYGPEMTVNTASTFTVVTQFLTSDNTSTGALSEIRRLYIQNGKIIQNSVVNIPGIDPVDSITEAYCTKQKQVFNNTDSFNAKGGLAAMGESLARGTVLALSLSGWDGVSTNDNDTMYWLDSTYPITAQNASAPGVARGTCGHNVGGATHVGLDENIEVIYSNIRLGPIGSTFSGTA